MEDKNRATISRLLASEEPWVVYNTLVELVGASPEDSRAREAYGAIKE